MHMSDHTCPWGSLMLSPLSAALSFEQGCAEEGEGSGNLAHATATFYSQPQADESVVEACPTGRHCTPGMWASV